MHRISPALDAPGGVLRHAAVPTAPSLCVLAGRSGTAFLRQGKNGEPIEAAWLLDRRDFEIPQTVYAFFQCRATGPGGILVTSDSKCDASLDVNGIVVTITANR